MKRLLSSAIALLFGALALAPLAASCSSSTNSSPPQCNQNPWQCPTGQTCWIKDTAPTYACINSGTGQAGAACKSYVGTPTCSDGLFCFQQDTNVDGICVPFCDPNNSAHGCTTGQCTPIAFNNNTSASALIHGCANGLPPADGGTEAGPPGDAAADTSPPVDSGIGPTDSGSGDAADGPTE